MFDIGPSELLVIFVVALLVIGPERLPSAVKTASLWIGRFRRSFHKIKAEVERELNADEIRRQLHNETILAEVEDAKKQAREFARDVEKSASLEEDKEPPSASQQADGSKPESGESATDGKSSSKEGVSSVKNDIRQAVNYVNDISREVKTTGQEIEDQFSKKSTGGSGSSDDKS